VPKTQVKTWAHITNASIGNPLADAVECVIPTIGENERFILEIYCSQKTLTSILKSITYTKLVTKDVNYSQMNLFFYYIF